ncbi:MAG: DoxX family membrane protein [Gemmatimonadetes bacterium]|nr:DoxX family membrane protein [Gemmatimonadota bacterium]
MRRQVSRFLLAALFVAAGVLHFAFPDPYVRIVPPYLPRPWALVYLSGALEIAGGVGLLVPFTRRAAALGLVLLLVAVWPANLQMLLDARASDASPGWQALLWARIPLQPALMLWVGWAAAVLPRRRPRTGPS